MNDDELLAGVREAFTVLDPVPADVLAAARASIAWLAPSATLAELERDRSARAAAGVRGAASRVLTFACPDGSVEIEVSENGRDRELMGRLVPSMPAHVEVRHRDLPRAEITTRAEHAGLFCVPRVPAGLVSLAFRLDDGTTIVTSWIRL
ncbi:hypothetical protein BZB76_5836 [Actinomadura pelletieri DSM 43383]|uniref:Uncharacterized protein n=1 Tax=Actinomadura pelletieri DSM 43383 TaxID=1120940 RepID=A0A495QB12_9ACTN|nr:hypothetical protein [Actinomadura pelletieri]RKS68711.1 hypothetical protein BZB76_5836 [Actinomadura pelletieri DSM 43383]